MIFYLCLMKKSIFCIGSALIDELYFCHENIIPETSNPATLQKNVGGVISNISQHLALFDYDINYLTVIGNDIEGNWIEDEFIKKGININHSLKVNDPTGRYVSILNMDGSLFTAACVDICPKYCTPDFLETKRETIHAAELIITDTNIEIESLQWLIDLSNKQNIPLIIEPVSVVKARKISKLNMNAVFMVTPNEDELPSLCIEHHTNEKDSIKELLDRGIKFIWVRKGDKGSTIYSKEHTIELHAPKIKIIDSTGAGDAALAGWICGFLEKENPNDCLKLGHTLALEVLQIKGAVKNNINKNILFETVKKYYPNAQ